MSTAGRGAGDPRAALGLAGEAQAADWYRARGWELLAERWRGEAGEIDLILRRRSTVVFCEVKSRSGTRFGEPVEAVTSWKQARLRRAAAEWLATARPGATELRFDVASVGPGCVAVLEGAF